MKTHHSFLSSKHLIVLGSILSYTVFTQGQGTITFDASAGLSSTYYYETGMWFHVIIPSGNSYDDMGIIGPIPQNSNVPQNSTPYMLWLRQFNSSDYVAFSLTNSNTFGLTSVKLADPNSPSSSQVPISFIGFLGNGSSVTNTFTTPGGGATTFQNYVFTAAFASGLTSVDILAPRWAMDNLVFTVPEPAAVSLFLLGSGICLYVRQRHQRS